jgi:hypothetical protein
MSTLSRDRICRTIAGRAADVGCREEGTQPAYWYNADALIVSDLVCITLRNIVNAVGPMERMVELMRAEGFRLVSVLPLQDEHSLRTTGREFWWAKET